jgi:hypothetical protein
MTSSANISTCRSIMGSRIPPSSKINCEIHTDVQIGYFCGQHDVVCCRACLSESHRSCESNVSVIYSCSSNVSESKDEFLTSFEAESKGKTDSQDL